MANMPASKKRKNPPSPPVLPEKGVSLSESVDDSVARAKDLIAIADLNNGFNGKEKGKLF